VLRATVFPGTTDWPGFAAGPCLMKDTMQLAAFATVARQFLLRYRAVFRPTR
jgi:hypothetical protein